MLLFEQFCVLLWILYDSMHGWKRRWSRVRTAMLSLHIYLCVDKILFYLSVDILTITVRRKAWQLNRQQLHRRQLLPELRRRRRRRRRRQRRMCQRRRRPSRRRHRQHRQDQHRNQHRHRQHRQHRQHLNRRPSSWRVEAGRRWRRARRVTRRRSVVIASKINVFQWVRSRFWSRGYFVFAQPGQ